MKELKENLDLLAIAVLIAVLGLAHAPHLTPRISTIRMEHSEPKLRIQKLQSRLNRIPERLNRIPERLNRVPERMHRVVTVHTTPYLR